MCLGSVFHTFTSPVVLEEALVFIHLSKGQAQFVFMARVYVAEIMKISGRKLVDI